MKKVENFFGSKFNYNIELLSLKLSVHGLNVKYQMMAEKDDLEKEMIDLENEIFKKTNPILSKVNILIYKIRQKINILNQISLLKSLIAIFEKHPKMTKYEDLFQYLNEFGQIYQYDSNENAKFKIIDFIEKMSKIKG